LGKVPISYRGMYTEKVGASEDQDKDKRQL
jgi:hypothetical protein